MDRLSREFLDACRSQDGRLLRGENMTRIETFVDAAFAFAFTMLVISIDEIPSSPQELLELSRDIPAFILSAAVVGSIWLAHSNWSRTFGLQDRLTIYLSLGLVMLVLIFVYPIKLMCQATILYLSDGQLGTPLGPMGWEEVADLVVYFALGLLALSLIVVSLYLNALRHREELVLSGHEVYFCKRTILAWLVVLVTALVSISIVAFTEEQRTAWAGLVYFSLLLTIPVVLHVYAQHESSARTSV